MTTQKNTKEIAREKLIAKRNRDRKPVTGKFIFHEVPGGEMKLSFRQYKEDPIEKFTFVDNEIYTIPYGVAKHLNTNCWYPVHSHALDENGKPSMKIGQKIRRCSFQSLQFMEDDDLNAAPSVITVEEVSNKTATKLKSL